MALRKKWRVRQLELLEIPDQIRNHPRYKEGLEYDSARITEDGRYVKLTFEDGTSDTWGNDPSSGQWLCLNDPADAFDAATRPPDLTK
jgi:hypothetical protein